jgi:hypothetical protein
MRELTVRQLQELLNPLDDTQLDVVERAIRILTDAFASATAEATAVPSRSNHP